MMSEESSGGVCESTSRTAFTTASSGSWMASVISFELTSIVRGSPATWSRPRTCMVSGRSSGSAEPISILTLSAVRSPISTLYFSLDITGDGLVELIAAHPHRGADDDIV